MPTDTRPVATLAEHIDINDMFAISVWAHHFCVSEQHVKDAVQDVGNTPAAVENYFAALPQVNHQKTESL